MDAIATGIRYIVDMGPTVLVPAVILLLSLMVGVRPGKALRAALMVGVGFVGINLIINMMNENLGAAASMIAERMHMDLMVIDVGWPGAAPMAWASEIAVLAIPVAVGVNLVMVALRLTRTISVDIWNIWHMIFNGALAYAQTGNYFLGLIGVAVYAAISYKLGDLWAPLIGEYFMMDEITIPHGTSAVLAPIAYAVDLIIEMIPGLRKIDISLEWLQDRAGILGEPVTVGAILGTVLGFQAGYPPAQALPLGIQMAAIMVLMPRIVKCLMEGLIPFTEKLKERLDRYFEDGTVYIGLDPALLLGDPQVVTAGLLLIPLTLALAAIIPGNKVLPFGDLATTGFFIAIAVAIHRGNLFRTLISGSLIMTFTIRIANLTAPWVTELARSTQLLQTDGMITALDQGGSPITYVYTSLTAGRFGADALAVAILYFGCVAVTVLNRSR